MANIMTAAQEFYRRPADERYASPEALVAFSVARKAASREISYNVKDLKIVAAGERKIQLASPKGVADLTHWSHGQLARIVGAPAGYLRTLPAAIAADALNHGLQSSSVGTTATILAQLPMDGGTGVTARAITSETYGRLWDADYYGPVVDTLGKHGFALPPTWDGKPAGAYASDRDSFLIMVNGGSMVVDPSVREGKGAIYRGVMLRNSEVGLTAVTAEEVHFEMICGNHTLWGAVIARAFRRRHVGTRVLRDVLREVGTIARDVTNRAASVDEALIKQLIDREIATSREAVVDELRKMGATETQAATAYDTCEQSFNASPRSFWGIGQGMTKASQASGYQDERLELDRLAAQILRRGAQLVAA